MVDGREALVELPPVSAPQAVPTKHGLSILIYRERPVRDVTPDPDQADREWLAGAPVDVPIRPKPMLHGIEVNQAQYDAYVLWRTGEFPNLPDGHAS